MQSLSLLMALRKISLLLLLLVVMVGFKPCVACSAAAAAGPSMALLDWHLKARAPLLRLLSTLIAWTLSQHSRRRLYRRWGRRDRPR